MAKSKITKLHRYSIVVIIVLASIAISACSKDEKASKNYFRYNDKVALIGTALAENSGGTPAQGVYSFDVAFLENTLTLHLLDGYPDSLSGKGDLLILAMLSSDSTGIKPGEYVYSSNENTYVANTFGSESFLAINIDSSVNEDFIQIELNGGKITVKKNGNEYEFIWSITTKINSTITGYYKGRITTYNYYSGKKTARNNPFANYRKK